MADDTAPIPFPDKDMSAATVYRPDPEPEVVPAKERLAAAREKMNLETGHERGIGSPYSTLHPKHKAHLAALEHLIEVETEHLAAEKALAVAHEKVERALARAASTEEASDAELTKEPHNG